MAKPTRLTYLGTEGDRKGNSFPGVPAKDLDENDLAQLSAERIDEIQGYPDNGLGPLYVDPDAKKQRGPTPPDIKRRQATAETKEAPEVVPVVNVGIEVTSEPEGKGKG